uniref:Secreted protein n=1 Tax=Ascaris lumbricoides TaxID=6252 RepID=A0A0M3HTW7_ASCLU
MRMNSKMGYSIHGSVLGKSRLLMSIILPVMFKSSQGRHKTTSATRPGSRTIPLFTCFAPAEICSGLGDVHPRNLHRLLAEKAGQPQRKFHPHCHAQRRASARPS